MVEEMEKERKEKERGEGSETLDDLILKLEQLMEEQYENPKITQIGKAIEKLVKSEYTDLYS